MGMAALLVGAFLLEWDWVWFAIGGVEQYFLGYGHLIFSRWAIAITVIGLKRTPSMPVWLGIVFSLLVMPVAQPFAIMFMRSPV
jgi:hypothetical protein